MHWVKPETTFKQRRHKWMDRVEIILCEIQSERSDSGKVFMPPRDLAGNILKSVSQLIDAYEEKRKRNDELEAAESVKLARSTLDRNQK